MEPYELDADKYVDILFRAFPSEEDIINLKHRGTTMSSAFRVCRICGSLVLESMTTTHVHEIHMRNAKFD